MNSDPVEKSISKFVKRAIWLSWFTIGFNLLEGAVSIFFGISEESIALAGFGGDSLIEVGSAMLVLWRFRSEEEHTGALSLERERTSTLGIGILFVLLAIVTVAGSSIMIFQQQHPGTTLPGLIVSSVSISFMFYLWSAKKKVGLAIGSSTVMKDAACSMACIKLSFILFFGSLIYIVLPSLWWVDSLAAMGLSILIGHEGLQTIKAARSPEFSGGCGCSD